MAEMYGKERWRQGGQNQWIETGIIHILNKDDGQINTENKI